ncbi:MAG: FtsX-like permease family protein, partial [Dehalococcoidia bacterium]
KSEIVDQANEIASLFVSIFTVFGLFSIGVGVLLIFLIFTMLAAERKSEMGMSRAIGMQRSHLIQMFVAEGGIYSIGAAAVGAALGVAVGFGLVYAVADAFAQGGPSDEFRLTPHTSLRSVLVAFFTGAVFTFLTVSFASWRVSRLNIVRAVRDIPDPQMARASRHSLVWGIILIVLGLLLVWTGFRTAQFTVFGLGASLTPMGLALALRYFGVPQRAVLIAVGLYLLTFWLLPASVFDAIKDDWNQNFSVFFVSGSLVVTGGVLVAMNNSRTVLGMAMGTLGRIQRLAPMVKSAVSYPLRTPGRTGLSVAIFAAIIFSIIVMASVNTSFDQLFDDQDRLTGGYEVIAQGPGGFAPFRDSEDRITRLGGGLNPVTDLAALVKAEPTLDIVSRVDGQPSVGTLRTIFDAEGRLAGASETAFLDTLLTGVDDDFIGSNQYALTLATSEFATSDGFDRAAVWQTLQERPGTAVVSAHLVPTRNGFTFAGGGDRFRLDVEGLYIENDAMDPIEISVLDKKSGTIVDLTVIGVVDDRLFFFFVPPAVFTSTRTLEAALPRTVNPTRLFFNVERGAVDADRKIEAALFPFGMDTIDLNQEIDDRRSSRKTLLDLLTGFMALGLVVGIAAIGVISARAVVERRHHIGVLRAIGFSRGMIALSFLMESSFIAAVGIAIGLATGLITSFNIVQDLQSEEAGISLVIPWVRVVIIVGGAYLFSLVTTILPARQAAVIAPADALRYE